MAPLCDIALDAGDVRPIAEFSAWPDIDFESAPAAARWVSGVSARSLWRAVFGNLATHIMRLPEGAWVDRNEIVRGTYSTVKDRVLCNQTGLDLARLTCGWLEIADQAELAVFLSQNDVLIVPGTFLFKHWSEFLWELDEKGVVVPMVALPGRAFFCWPNHSFSVAEIEGFEPVQQSD